MSPRNYAAQRLRANGDSRELNRITQEECRRKAAKKLPATLLCADFIFPTALSAEQCTSDDIATLHASWIKQGEKVADLTAGLGIDSFHIARNAAALTAIDINPIIAEALAHNATALSLDNVTAVCADCIQWLSNTPDNSFDTLFIDPARRGVSGQRLYSLADCQPDVVSLLPEMLRVANRVIIKMSPMLDINQVLKYLPNTKELHIVGTQTECKELVAVIERTPTDDPLLCVDIVGSTSLTLLLSQLTAPTLFAHGVNVGDIVGEPYPAVAKSKFPLSGLPLSPNTQLWINPDEDFPGKRYTVTRIEPFSSSSIKRLSREKVAASVCVKNLPISSAELSKRLRASESAHQRIIAAPTAQGHLLLFVAPR